MPKRFKDNKRTIFVKFNEDVTDKEARRAMSSMDVGGTKVSTLINRWAVEVPFWKEALFVERFYQNELVERVHGFDMKISSFQEEAPSEE